VIVGIRVTTGESEPRANVWLSTIFIPSCIVLYIPPALTAVAPGQHAGTRKVGRLGWSLFSTSPDLRPLRSDYLPFHGYHMRSATVAAHGTLAGCTALLSSNVIQLLCGHRVCIACAPGSICPLCQMRTKIEVAAAAAQVARNMLTYLTVKDIRNDRGKLNESLVSSHPSRAG